MNPCHESRLPKTRAAPFTRAVLAFALARRAGAMLIGGSLAMLSMAGVGGMIVDYGWRESQDAEVEAALRAGVGTAAQFMRGNLSDAEDKIKQRVADVMRGLLDGLIISKDDIDVDHDFATNRTVVKVAGNATFAYKSLWRGGGRGDPVALQKQVTVEFDASQFEFALALDVSTSMGGKPTGWTVTKLAALKDAIATITTAVEEISTTNPGILAVSLVPYSNVVNVADTSGTSKTDAKERYVWMLTGAEYSTQTSRDTEAHWVDSFHSYGTGDDMGPLASRSLPDFLAATDWNLHQQGTEDVSSQAPTLGTWDLEGEDFWNGCVMARWGAYWDTAARPPAWDPSDAGNWPATKTVAGWEPGATGITDLPLHLSDAPPDASDPNTRFTAYSWPDARLGAFADHRLDNVMRRTIDSSFVPSPFYATSDNHWHLRAIDRGGSLLCPEAFIVPLTDDTDTLKLAQDYKVVQSPALEPQAQTFLHLGIVWGLRTLSPLWRDVWKTKGASGDDLPRKPCLAGETQGCSQLVEKAIVLISDGDNAFGSPRRGRTVGWYEPGRAITTNPISLVGWCQSTIGGPANAAFRDAVFAGSPTDFANSFDVETSGIFTAAGLSNVLDGFQHMHPVLSSLNPALPTDQVVIDAHRALWQQALKDMTPWQLFRGYDDSSPTKDTDAIDVLVDPANAFGFQGRPVQNGHFCRPHSAFSAYGRVEDPVRVGDGSPVEDVAPFADPAWSLSTPPANLTNTMLDRLDDWFLDACTIAGQRGVRIHAIYIGNDQTPRERSIIELLEDCVDRGYGGSPLVDEVHATPTAQELKDAIEEIVDIRRTLRFIDD